MAPTKEMVAERSTMDKISSENLYPAILEHPLIQEILLQGLQIRS